MLRLACNNMRRIVIVGVSLAGLRGAEELRRAGFSGDLTLIGREPHFPPIDRPPLSKEVLSGRWSPDEARLRSFQNLDATLRLGEIATALDLANRTVRLASGDAVPFDGLMITTGANVRKLRCPGADLAGVTYFRDLEDCQHLQRRLAMRPRILIVGAGFIGSEVAAVCAGMGLPVCLIDAAPLPLADHLGPSVAKFLLEQHRRSGVDVRLGVGIEAIVGRNEVEAVRLSDGNTLATDVVVVGIGVNAATSWLEGSGLAIEKGVQCDEHCRALGAHDIVAAGDVALWRNPRYDRLMRVEHWTNAVEQAEYAARALLGRVGTGYRAVPYFWSNQYDLHLQFAGLTSETSQVVEGSFEDRKFVVEYSARGKAVGVLAINSVARFQRLRRALSQDVTTTR